MFANTIYSDFTSKALNDIPCFHNLLQIRKKNTHETFSTLKNKNLVRIRNFRIAQGKRSKLFQVVVIIIDIVCNLI